MYPSAGGIDSSDVAAVTTRPLTFTLDGGGDVPDDATGIIRPLIPGTITNVTVASFDADGDPVAGSLAAEVSIGDLGGLVSAGTTTLTTDTDIDNPVSYAVAANKWIQVTASGASVGVKFIIILTFQPTV